MQDNPITQNPNSEIPQELYTKIVNILEQGRGRALQSINENMLMTYWEIGKEIVESEQSGELRAGYGEKTLNKLSIKLSSEHGKGYSVDNLAKMRFLYNTFQKSETLSRKLSWSHYYEILKIKDNNELMFYYNLIDGQYRSIRILKSEISSHLYQRRLAGTVVKEVVAESKQLEGQGSVNQIIVNDPIVVDFLGIQDGEEYNENELETRIIQHLQRFLLELGRGFAFVSRQQRISIDGMHFRTDLVFYNYILKCFVIVDLKTRKIDHGDIGQMQMYVNFYDREVISEGDNKTIGIIIAEQKDDIVVKFTLPLDNQQIFTARYSTIIPSENEFKSLLNSLPLEEK